MKKLQITLTIILILASALLWAVKPQPAQAMRRESDPVKPVAVAQVEVRVILIGKSW